MNTVEPLPRQVPPRAPPPSGGLSCFDKLTEEDVNLLLEEEEAIDDSGGKRIFCANCNEPICKEGDRIEQRGAHQHRFSNPHGIEYLIGCFRNAAVSPAGARVREFTWFPGFSWQVVTCPACLTHLGWQFRSDDGENFYGLILENLRNEE